MFNKISWIDANGNEYVLEEPHYKVLLGMSGLFMPPVDYIEDEIPLQPGSNPRQVKIKPREIDIPLKISGSTEVELLTKIRELLYVFYPSRGDGRLKVTAIDGSQRELFCRYVTGMELNNGKDSFGQFWQKAILLFRAFDPYWYSANAHVLQFATGEPATFFPIFPLRLSSSQVFADISTNNEGDVETWPEWIITGPGENIALKNITTGKTLTINYALDIGETIIINTKPGAKTVKKNDGTNLYRTMAPESSLWPLVKGNNSIRIELSNSTQDSLVQLTYYDRFLGA